MRCEVWIPRADRGKQPLISFLGVGIRSIWRELAVPQTFEGPPTCLEHHSKRQLKLTFAMQSHTVDLRSISVIHRWQTVGSDLRDVVCR